MLSVFVLWQLLITFTCGGLQYGGIKMYECAGVRPNTCKPIPSGGKHLLLEPDIKIITKDMVNDSVDVRDIIGTPRSIEEIERGCFEGLPKLKRIWLGGQNFKIIPHGIFNGLPLEYLYLAANDIAIIETEAFQGRNLKRLFLDKNQLSHFDPNWFGGDTVESLIALYVHHNNIRFINRKAFHQFPRLEKIDFSFNQIEYISDDIFNHTVKILEFDLSFNRLKVLASHSFHGLKKVEFFSVSFNYLVNIDNYILDDVLFETMSVHPNLWSCPCLTEFENVMFRKNITSISADDVIQSQEYTFKNQMQININEFSDLICCNVRDNCSSEYSSDFSDFEMILNNTYNSLIIKCRFDEDCNVGMLCKSGYCWALIRRIDFNLLDQEYFGWYWY